MHSAYEEFRKLIRLNYLDYNMFSFRNSDRNYGSCCAHQTLVYIKFGHKKGISPLNYLKKLTDFDDKDKQVVHIHYMYVPELCVNVITKLGFGRGKLSFSGGKLQGKPFGMFVYGDQRWHVFHKDTVKLYLTFQWFKQNVVCAERPLICMRSP